MSFGAGLAGFVRGLDTGMSIRERYDANKERKAQKAQRDQINFDTKTAFAEAKAAGAVQDGDFMTFYQKYALPKQQALLVEQGDYSGAKALGEWSKSDDAQNGARLFGSAMVKAQSGDYDGAIQDAIAASQLKGYVNTDHKLTGSTPIQQNGKTIGYQFQLSDGDGKSYTRNIRLQDIPNTIATYVNPEAAWQTQTATAAAEKKREDEITDYRKKKSIDKEYSNDKTEDAQAKRYSDTRAAMEKAREFDEDWTGMTEQQKDQAVRDQLSAADKYGSDKKTAKSGASSAAPGITPEPQKRMIIDTATGKPIATPEQSKAIGISAPTTPEQSAPAVPAAPAKKSLPTMESTIADATDQLSQGANPDMVKQQLLNAGVPETNWPEQLTKPQKTAGNGAVGISF
ncbi:hypothetical protein M8994_17195 [Brucella sp. 21LCYQ03]|nr:hypothetical protein [Brucella sp. 21LCYQ03]